MHNMTQANLQNAFSGESQAHMRYIIFSEIAEKEKKPNIAKLFKAIAYAERVHATNHLKALGMVKETKENLGLAIAGETFEVEEMYPVYNNDARFQKEKEAERSTYYALEAERIHAQLYQRAREALSKGKDIALEKIYICPICGYTTVKEPEDFCPVCGAKRDTFKEF